MVAGLSQSCTALCASDNRQCNLPAMNSMTAAHLSMLVGRFEATGCQLSSTKADAFIPAYSATGFKTCLTQGSNFASDCDATSSTHRRMCSCCELS
jgi:hypothetical protein